MAGTWLLPSRGVEEQKQQDTHINIYNKSQNVQNAITKSDEGAKGRHYIAFPYITSQEGLCVERTCDGPWRRGFPQGRTDWCRPRHKGRKA